MVHSKGLVVCVKVDGKVMKENHETVHVPFDNEYTILLKNLKPTQKALVDVFIDGQTAIRGLIVPAGQSVELERFHDGRDSKGRRFMFVEKDASVEERRENQVEDGLIRVEYRFEEKPCYPPYVTTTWTSGGPWKTRGGSGDWFDAGNITCQAFAASSNVMRSMAPQNDAGITERGSVSNQKFVAGYIGTLESERHQIVLSIKGFHEPDTSTGVWVKDMNKPKFKKRFCPECGAGANIGANFCSNCGEKL